MTAAIPGPRGQWLVGDVTAYQRDRIGWLSRARDRYGDVVRLSPDVVTVHHPELAHQVLVTTNTSFTVDNGLSVSRRARAAHEVYLADWMRVRREVWHAISERITEAHLTRFTARYTADLAALAGREIDLVNTCRIMLGRAIVDFCAGAEPDTAALDTLAGAADELFGTALRALVSHEGRVFWWPRPHARRAMAANARLLELLAELVRHRLAAGVPEQPRDLVDALAGRAGTGTDREVGQVVSVLRTIMFASHGVPGAALSWIVLRLAQHPEVAARVAAGDAGYAEAVVKETLRLHPPQWLITRTTAAPVRIGGYQLPPRTEVVLCPYLIHRDPRWWSAPDQFDPDRFLGPGQQHARHAYLPFGAGPRVCPGSLLASTQLTILTRLLARDYTPRFPAAGTVSATTNGLLLPEDVTGRWEQVTQRDSAR